MTISTDLLRLKLAEALEHEPPTLTRRDVRLPRIPNKTKAVIGVRRGGKTTFLAQCRAARIEGGSTSAAELFLSFEDERLAGMEAADLDRLLQEHAREVPNIPNGAGLYLDEIHLVRGWEGLVRRVMDRGDREIHISGSSAKLISREVATSLRGRGMDVLIHPFSFREVLRHAGEEPAGSYKRLPLAHRAMLDRRLRRYLIEGGFPEVQGADPRDRAALLAGYVDVLVLRDVIERHAVSNPVALRWLERQLLANPGGEFSVRKHYEVLRSQGLPVGKDTLHEFLGHLEDAFLIRTISMHSSSERQRMVNPRKAYPVDPGLISIFERTGRTQTGRALKTAVLLQLERRGFAVSYLRTSDGYEVDFLAERRGEPPWLVQVCLETAADSTWQRELRAIEAAAAQVPAGRRLVVSLDSTPPRHPLPEGIEWAPAARWLLEMDPD